MGTHFTRDIYANCKKTTFAITNLIFLGNLSILKSNSCKSMKDNNLQP